jgi:hypothetical protein
MGGCKNKNKNKRKIIRISVISPKGVYKCPIIKVSVFSQGRFLFVNVSILIISR